MNKQRKHNITNIRIQLRKLKSELQIILDEEQEYFDNIPENLQSSLRGSESEDALDIMEKCVEELENIIKELMEI